MKICIITTPIRPVPTAFPPFGSLAIIQSLRNNGEEVHFHHIDFHRWNADQNYEYFKSKAVLKLHSWFKSHNHIKWGIACGLILPCCGPSLYFQYNHKL